MKLPLHGRLRLKIVNKIDATAVNRFREVVVTMFPEYITQGFLIPERVNLDWRVEIKCGWFPSFFADSAQLFHKADYFKFYVPVLCKQNLLKHISFYHKKKKRLHKDDTFMQHFAKIAHLYSHGVYSWIFLETFI